MALEVGDGEDPELLNNVFRSLEKPERRRILFGLLEHNPQKGLLIPEDVHHGEKDLDRLNIALVHHHLPVLEEIGLIRWDQDANEVHKGPCFSDVKGLLETLKDMTSNSSVET